MLNNVLYIGFFFGVLGTFIGGLIGVFVKFKSNKTLSCILEFAAGLMLAVVSFDLLPESFELGGNFVSILFFIIGVVVAVLLENVINKFSHVGAGPVSARKTKTFAKYELTVCRGRPRVDPHKK